MSRTLKRPMFRMGGAAGTGITSGLDRKPFQQGTDPYDRALTTTERYMSDMDRFKGVSDMSIIDEVTNDEQSQEYINQVKESQEGGLAKLFKTLVGLAIPGSNFFMGNKGPLQGIKALNQRLRNTDFAKSKTLADYFDARSYGGRDARDRAAAKTMREARALRKQIDMRKSARATNQDKGRGQIISRTNSAPKSSRSSGFSSSARGKALHG